jgi:MYXO-CTERM domain-containing protein
VAARLSAAAVLLLLWSGEAAAWRQSYTREDPTIPLKILESNCWTYTVLEACSEDVAYTQCRSAIENGFRVWSEQTCSYLRLLPTEPATCCIHGYQQDGPNANCVRWLEDVWPEDYPRDGIALTTITYQVDNGRILDTDIEMNGVGFGFGMGCERGLTDIWNTVAHEAGHVLGLDHTDVPGATMRPRSAPGDCTLRDLAEDDIEGVCAIYPWWDDPMECAQDEPFGGLDLACTPPPEDCGCRAPGAARPAAGLPALLALLALAALRRRPPPPRTGR